LVAPLPQLSPLKILDRGYAIVSGAGGEVVKDASQARAGSEIAVRLAHGRLAATVTESSGGE
jgi:exodeoxyribonuclease VII large subunit